MGSPRPGGTGAAHDAGWIDRLRGAFAAALRPRRAGALANEKFTDALERELVRRAQGIDTRHEGW